MIIKKVIFIMTFESTYKLRSGPLTMAIRVVEFSNGGYKIRKIFA